MEYGWTGLFCPISPGNLVNESRGLSRAARALAKMSYLNAAEIQVRQRASPDAVGGRARAQDVLSVGHNGPKWPPRIGQPEQNLRDLRVLRVRISYLRLSIRANSPGVHPNLRQRSSAKRRTRNANRPPTLLFACRTDEFA
jgi:hypothetical protein